ncbi:DUF2341 domain-containing protein, partial [Candidatus Micrarchaeota archaeon]|nr:DUF2341 domain-containing protein [Candidatus Micrarchaeota archaeon]
MASKKKNISYILNKVVKGILSIANYIGTAVIQAVLWLGEVIWWLLKSLLILIVSLPSLFKKNKTKRTVFKKASSRSRAANPLLKPFSNKDMRRKLLPGLVVVLLFLAGFAVYNLRQAQETEAHWWDETWLYRRAIQISNDNGEDLEDFQVAITLDTAGLIAEGKMQATCDDLRITDNSGNVIPHWIEENNPGCDNASTKVWTKVPTVYDGADATTIYAYYGNAQASNAENGDNVFEFFDDFSKDTRGQYGRIQTNHDFAIDANNNYLYDIFSSTGYTYSYHKNTSYQSDFVASFRIYQNGWGGIFLGDENAGYHIDFNKNRYSVRTYGGGSNSPIVTSNLPSIDTWINGEIIRSGSNWKILKEGSLVFDWTESSQWKENVKPGFVSSYYSGEYYRWDRIFIRQYAATEPSTTLNSEEQSPGPVAYWKFDEGAGTTANDSSGQGNDGTLINSPTWQTEDLCVSGKCLEFDGSTAYISTSNPSLKVANVTMQ